MSSVEERGAPGRVGSREVLAEWGFGLLLALASSLPHLYFWAGVSPPGFSYGWAIPPYPEDVLAYTAWVKQASDSAFLFTVKYTAIAQEPQIIQPYFFAVGQLQRLLGSSAGFALFVARIIAVIVFGRLLLMMLRDAGLETEKRFGSALLIGFATGVGSFFVGDDFTPSDLWVVDLNVFWSLAWNGLFAFALCLLVGFAILFRRGLRAAAVDTRRTCFLGAGACLAVLAFVHPYDVFVAGCIAIALIVFDGGRRTHRELIEGALCVAISALPAGLYQLLLSMTHPVLSRHAELGGMESPSPTSYALGLGLPLAFAVVGAIGSFRGRLAGVRANRQVDLRWLVVWVLLCGVAAYLPIWFQRKMVFGIGIPIGALASIGIALLCGSGARSRVYYWLAVGSILLLSFAGSHRHNLQAAVAGVRSDPVAYFDSDAFVDVTRFLDRETSPEDVVLADLLVSRSLPGRSGNTVVYGHWAQTVDLKERIAWLRRLFGEGSTLSPEQKRNELLRSPVSFVLIDQRMVQMLGGALPTWLQRSTRSIYRAGGYEVLEVIRP